MNSQSNKNELIIEHMAQDEVNIAIEWAQKEGWNPGINDAKCFFYTDSQGFYAVKRKGEIVATIAIVNYSDSFCFEGLYIVKPEFRGRGIGSYLQKFALNLCKNSNLGLDGMLSMQKIYEQYGLKAAYKNTRYAGIAQKGSSEEYLLLQKKDFDDISVYDSEFFPANRSRFLECWLFQKDSSCMLMRNEKTNRISGYGVIRKCTRGHKIGPLFADNKNIAELLFNSLSSTVPNQEIFLDIPELNNEAVVLANKRGMQPVFSTIRMYSKYIPNLPLNKIFGVTSFELG